MIVVVGDRCRQRFGRVTKRYSDDVSTPASVVVVGGGPAGLIAAETLARAGCRVSIIEHMPTVGRKLLLAGRGGLNLTHSEPADQLISRYGQATARLEQAIGAFPPASLRAWSAALGQPTFVGSSGRVFPTTFRATQLLRAWIARLSELDVTMLTRHEWRGWTHDGALRVEGPHGDLTLRPDATILAMGGASWPRTGSTAAWVPTLRALGVEVTPLQPANCGFIIEWSDSFRERFAGVPLKNVGLSVGGANARGEAMITSTGIEGGAVYAVGAKARDAIARDGHVDLIVDLHPDLSADQVRARLDKSRVGDSVSNRLRRAGLQPVAVALMRETNTSADQLKTMRLRLTGTQSIDRAISTAGGVALREIDDQFMLRRKPGVFIAGEMLDWEAPTGGYLLQACFSTGVAAAQGAISWLETQSPSAI
jgi:uncharacterized flavoprotein (TIGR03862 family)